MVIDRPQCPSFSKLLFGISWVLRDNNFDDICFRIFRNTGFGCIMVSFTNKGTEAIRIILTFVYTFQMTILGISVHFQSNSI